MANGQQHLDKRNWRKHAIWLFAICTALQPLIYFVYITSPDWLFIQFIILTMTSNIVALAYAVYAYKLYDETNSEFKRHIMALGIDPPTIDGVFVWFVQRAKPILDAMEKHKVTSDDVVQLLDNMRYVNRLFSKIDKNKLEALVDSYAKKVNSAKTFEELQNDFDSDPRFSSLVTEERK